MSAFLAMALVGALSLTGTSGAPAPQHALFLQRPLRQLPQQAQPLPASRTAQPEPIAIVKLNSDVSYDGNFVYEYEGANGIRSEARGALKNLGEDIEAQTVTGSFSFVGDDGQTYSISYTADENGYRPVGDHLPTPPPIPDAIVKALEFIARNPPAPEDDQSSGAPAARGPTARALAPAPAQRTRN